MRSTTHIGSSTTFKKKVRYLCGLFGHRVRHVTTRDGYEEFACFCGHSFLKEIYQPKGRTSPDPPSFVIPRFA